MAEGAAAQVAGVAQGAACHGATAACARSRRQLADTEYFEMAGSDKVDPAVAFLRSAGRTRIIGAPTGAAMMASRVSNPLKKC